MAENKKNKTWLWLSLATVGGLWLWSSTKDLLNTITFSFSGIGTGGSFLSPSITISLIANNPSIGSITVQQISCDVFYMNNNVGHVTLPQAFTVKPNSNTPFSLKLNISDLGALTTLYQIIVNGDQTGDSITLNGNAMADGITIPINLNYSV